jgi:hypothetical protein
MGNSFFLIQYVDGVLLSSSDVNILHKKKKVLSLKIQWEWSRLKEIYYTN